jgi:secreted PhoX family phosphatase
VPASTAFNGGEGIWYHAGTVYFTTKGDNRVWAYDAAAASLAILYDDDNYSPPPLTGVDNVTVTPGGYVLVAEDGGNMQIVAIAPGGEIGPVLQLIGHDSSEITGPALDPSGTRLYFSSQRGAGGGIGVTFEVTGPFFG